MVCEDPHQTRAHEVMCRPARTMPCRIICYSPLPLTQHPRHAAEVLSALRQRTLFGSSASSSTTLEAQQSTDQKQHAWNANSLPSTMNTASTISDMIAPPGHLSTGLLGFPFGTVANFGVEAVGLPRYTDIDLSLLIRSCGVGHGLSTIYQVFQLSIHL